MFKAMTWNVQNLFLQGEPSGPPTPAIFDAKIRGLAATINEESPDALALQEIGNPLALDALLQRLQGTWHRRVSQHPDGRHIRVAWLTRRTITASEDIFQFPAHLKPVQVDDDGPALGQMGRGGLAITVQSDGGREIRLVTTHLKSKLLTFPGNRFSTDDEDERARFAAYALYRRAAEAATLRVFITQALAKTGDTRPLIVTGDLNDTVQAATTQVFLGPPGSEIGTGGFDRPDKGDRERLWNLAPLMPEGQDFSRINQGRKELIDHVLVSAALVKPLTAITTRAINTQALRSITTDPNDDLAKPSSDHAAVIAQFNNI
jgi:endonuclease/exonuclease/phosphatase family metal-dependent hydrolase